MVQEIIYTSAPKGLKKGSRGFCTVVSTAGIGANLAERLESMSGYRHAFPLNDPNGGLNPVNYTHVTTRLAGQKLHVISRVADAGQDYSGRTNKLAHHIAIDNPATLTAGPARVLADPSTVISDWDESVTTRPPRTIGNPVIPDSIKLTAWNAAAGDNGWAGYMAEQLLSSRAPVNIIFAPGTDTLALVQEVLDLVPIPQRWTITFSTYFTRLLAGTECQLRFILAGTTEETSLRNDARAVTVDLTTTLPAASGGRLVAAARSGCLDFKQADQRSGEKRRFAASTQPPIVAVDSDEESHIPVTRPPDVPRAVGRGDSARSSRHLDRVFDANVQRGGRWITVSIALLLLGGVGAGAYLTVPAILRTRQQQQAQVNQISDSTGAEADNFAQVTPEVDEPPVAIPFEVTPKTPSLFGGKGPLDNFAQAETDGPFQWDAENEKTKETVIYTNSPQSVRFSVVEPQSLEILESDDEWEVRSEDTSIGRFILEEDSENNLRVHWQWDGATDADPSFWKQKSLVRAAKFTLSAEREDGADESREFALQFSAPDVFGGSKLTGQFLLPNPLTSDSVSKRSGPTLNLWSDQEVLLSFHSGFEKLIFTPGRRLELTKNGEKNTWTAQVADRQQSISLAKYSLVPVPAGGGRFRIEFHWLKAARGRELAAAELVRWCPLIVKVGAEHRLFRQREAERCLIPPWDRQKGFVIEQSPTEDHNRTEREFVDLKLQSGDDAFFELTYTLSADEEPKIFRGTLKGPVTQNTDGRLSEKIQQFVWFPLEDISAMQSISETQGEKLPEAGEICVLHTVILLPETRSRHANFQLETTAYVRPNVKRWFIPASGDLPELLQPSDRNPSGSESESELLARLLARLLAGDFTPQHEFGFVDGTKMVKEFNEQKNLLSKLLKDRRNWVNKERKKVDDTPANKQIRLDIAAAQVQLRAQRSFAKLTGGAGNTGTRDQIRKLEGHIKQLKRGLLPFDEQKRELNKRSGKAFDALKEYRTRDQSSYQSATTRWQEFMESFEKVRMGLTLGVKLKGTQPNETTEIVFLDAQMETPDDN